MRPEDDPTRARGVPRRGQLLFAALFMAFGGFLVLSYPGQTTWVGDTRLAAQPGFWPAVAVGGMVVFTALHLLRLRPRRFRRPDLREARRWLWAFEFCAWFLVYVFAVPVIGYLPGTAAFAAALTWRMGYRSRGMLLVALVFAVLVVVLFKAFLDVRIPGGAIYEVLPGALRSFFILNL